MHENSRMGMAESDPSVKVKGPLMFLSVTGIPRRRETGGSDPFHRGSFDAE